MRLLKRSSMDIKIHILPINVPLLIGLNVFMKSSLTMAFKDQNKRRKENWKAPRNYCSRDFSIKPVTKIM